MIKNGLKKIVKKRTDRSFHRTYGGVSPLVLPDEFSVDLGKTMPDQYADNLPEACTAYTQLELCTDQDGIVYNTYEDLYRKTLMVENAPFGSGCDIRDSLKCTILYYGRGAYYSVESSKFDWFDSIRSVIYTNFTVNQIKCAVSIGTPWYKQWDTMSVDSTGIIPTIFSGDIKTLSWHNWAIKGWKTINGVPYLLAKTWQGKGYGDGGWAYYPREVINAVLNIRYTGAFTLAPKDAGNIQFVRMTFIQTVLELYHRLADLLDKKLKLSTS